MIPLVLAAGVAALSAMGVRAHATPELAAAKPMPEAGWASAVAECPEGRPIRRSGGRLGDGWRDEFVFLGRVNGEPGDALAVPVRQLCDAAEVAWVATAAPGQDPHDLAHSAPILRVGAPASGGRQHHGAQMAQGHGAHGNAHGHGHAHAHGHGAHDHGSHADGRAAGATQVGAISVTGAYARANPAPGGASAAYMSIASSAGADRLIAAESPVAARVELHTHTLDAQGVARMRQVESIEVPAGGAAELEPGGLHVMLMGLTAPLAAGQDIPLTLRFEKAGAVELTVPVRDVRGGGHGHHGG